jgi:uncharacterized membrane-anchored protein
LKSIHVPVVDARYWGAIVLASVFGTNLGDLYAHTSGFGIVQGVAVLAAIAAAVFAVERRDERVHELHYWLVILIIRTGATNIADYLAFRIRIPLAALTLGLALLLGVLAWRSARACAAAMAPGSPNLPTTDMTYWTAMLTAGVFGTVLGDVCSHVFGKGMAASGLGLLLALVFLARRRNAGGSIALYWFTVAVARTAGTAIGDWLAENRLMNLGLPLCTLLTGCAFLGILLAWPKQRPATPLAS